MIYRIIIAFILAFTLVKAQAKIAGTLIGHKNQEIKLVGYAGFKTKELSVGKVNELGNFELQYDSLYRGMAYLETEDNSSIFIVINEDNIVLNGIHLKDVETIVFSENKENQLYQQYSKENMLRQSALAGWSHLERLYSGNYFKEQTIGLKKIKEEVAKIKRDDENFIKNLNDNYYIKWFIPMRKIIAATPTTAKQYPEDIPLLLAKFRKINFNNPYFNTSGILASLIESHYWLIENGSMPLDSVYSQMNKSTDFLLANLAGNEKMLNETTNFLFDYLEKHSLFKASEYLAIKALTQNSCTLNDDLTNQLETYRIMKVGNTAPDILFTGHKMLKGITISGELKLSTMNNKYTLVVFGASWCPKCKTEIPKIGQYKLAWKEKGLETVFISLDTERDKFTGFAKTLPFLAVCDFKGWETNAAKKYHVFSTPTMFLLDKELKIVVRPTSIEQIEAWVNYKL